MVACPAPSHSNTSKQKMILTPFLLFFLFCFLRSPKRDVWGKKIINLKGITFCKSKQNYCTNSQNIVGLLRVAIIFAVGLHFLFVTMVTVDATARGEYATLDIGQDVLLHLSIHSPG